MKETIIDFQKPEGEEKKRQKTKNQQTITPVETAQTMWSLSH